MKKSYETATDSKPLAVFKEEKVDTSDIPELDERFWEQAKLSQPKIKSVVSVRLSQEVIDHFKAESPKGYTGRMAAVLQAYVNARQR